MYTLYVCKDEVEQRYTFESIANAFRGFVSVEYIDELGTCLLWWAIKHTLCKSLSYIDVVIRYGKW